MGCAKSKLSLQVPVPPTVYFLLADPDRAALYYPKSDPDHDNPLATVYRIYASIVSGKDLSLRSEIEYFWNHPEWKVSQIPDPKDPDILRYTAVAAIPYLLVDAFNRLIRMGLPRDAPAIISSFEEELILKARPKQIETVPNWAKKVQPLAEVLIIPDGQGNIPTGLDDKDADPRMRLKNILTTSLPIFFV